MTKIDKSTSLTNRELIEKIRTSHEPTPSAWGLSSNWRCHPPPPKIQFDLRKYLDSNRLLTNKGKRRTQKQQLRSQKVRPRC